LAVYINRQDKISQTALDYLQEQYGIPSGDIRSLEMRASVDDFTTLKVELLVNAPDPKTAS
jgi:hypothetical protein